MTRPSQYVDISQFPADEKTHIVDLAQKHNALCLDVDGISGITPEAKQEFHGSMGWVRKVCHIVHSRRFHVLVGFATVHYGLSMLKQLGLNPDQASRLAEALIKIIEKFAS